VDNSPREPDASVRFEGNLFAYNDAGVSLLPLVKRNTYVNNVFQENGVQVSVTGGGELVGNQWAVDERGNYWSDYVGFDADGDGRGDIPYRADSLYEDLLDRYPELRLFQLSPATQALDMASRAFPIFRPQPKMADEHPLMKPPTLAEGDGLPRRSTTAGLLAALGMLGMAAGILLLGIGLRKQRWGEVH
jgi:nitrous oxidase accessory protein